MRIGIDVRSLQEAQPTGVGEYTRAVVTELLRQAPEHEFRLYASGAHRVELPDVGQTQHPRATVKWLARPNKLLSAATVLAHRPVIDTLLGGLDVFFSPNLNFTALSPSLPHVLTLHDVSFELFPSFFSTKRRVWHKAVGARRLARTAAHVLCDSRSTADDVVATYSVPRERTTVVPLGVDAVFSNTPAQADVRRVREQYQLPARYILAVGTIEPRKNLVGLIKAYTDLRDRVSAPLGLVIAGPEGWKTRAFWRAVDASVNHEDIHVLGFVPGPDRAALLRGAACAVATSSYEGFGLPALEAMASGVPVVAAQTSSTPEVTADAALLVDPERPGQIAEALQAVLSDEALCGMLIAHGREQASRFAWSATARATLDVLQAVVDNRRWQLEPSTARSALVGGA